MDDPIDTSLSKEDATRIEETKAETVYEDTTKQLRISKLFEQMQLHQRITTDPGPHATIDVIPDFRYITYQLIDDCIRIYGELRDRDHPDLTPASILAMCLQHIYAYGTALDVYFVRETTSYYGKTFANEITCRQLLNGLTWNRIPPFIQDIIRGLVPTFDPRRKNLAYIYSFAAYSFKHDFGRIYPYHMFVALHNLIATRGKNATATDIWLAWLAYPVITIDGEQITVAHIIGAAYDDQESPNFISEKLFRLLSVTALDGKQRKAVFTRYPFTPVTVEGEVDNINPYHYLLGAYPNQLPQLTKFRNAIDSAFAEAFKDCIYLGEMFGEASGTHLMNHYYSGIQLPTYHNLKVKLTSTRKTSSFKTYAQALRFKCSYDCKEKPKIAVKSCPDDLPHEASLYLVDEKVELTTPIYETTIPYYSSSTQSNAIILYSPWNTGVSSMYYTLTNGICIESYEIDSFHVPTVKLYSTLHDENSHFLESAIPIKATICRDHLDGNTVLRVRQRPPDEQDTSRVSGSLIDMTQHTLPVYPNIIHNEGEPLSGFTKVSNIVHANLASTKVAYTSTDIWTKELLETTFPELIYLWSSYRWINPVNQNSETFLDSTYFLGDQRPQYGTFPETHKSRFLNNIIK